MTARRRPIIPALCVTLTIVLAGCAGAATSTPTGDAAPTGAAPSAGATAQDATTSDAPGASADGGTSADAGNTDPTCDLVTKDQVATAVGFPIARAIGGGGTCFFQNTDQSKYLSVQLFATVQAAGLYTQLEPNAEHVSGLGDDAFWLGTGGFLFVRKGDRAILFLDPDWVFTPDTDTTHRDALVTLAQSATAKL